MADLRKLTNETIRAYPVCFSSRDVREGICRLGDCHRAVPGLWYEPTEVLEGVFCFRKEALNLFQSFSSTFSGESLRSLWEKWVSQRGLFNALAGKGLDDLLGDPLVVGEIEKFLSTVVAI